MAKKIKKITISEAKQYVLMDYFAKYKNSASKELGYHSDTEFFDYLNEAFSVTSSKRRTDDFLPYYDNGTNGYFQSPKIYVMATYKFFESVSKNNHLQLVKDIMSELKTGHADETNIEIVTELIEFHSAFVYEYDVPIYAKFSQDMVRYYVIGYIVQRIIMSDGVDQDIVDYAKNIYRAKTFKEYYFTNYKCILSGGLTKNAVTAGLHKILLSICDFFYDLEIPELVQLLKILNPTEKKYEKDLPYPLIALCKYLNSEGPYYKNSIDRFDMEYFSDPNNKLKIAEVKVDYIDSGNVDEEDDDISDSQEDESIDKIEDTRVKGGYNLMVYGAPGTGKSYYIENEICFAHYTRVVFHPEYTYFNFVGSYKPVPVYRLEDGTYCDASEEISKHEGTVIPGDPFIDYRFVPGPFTDVLVKAWLHPEKMFYLVIEEINRAHAAAVFGEVFQLLDRAKGDNEGESEYSVSISADYRDYLESQGLGPYIVDGLRIPSNMSILATMNSADQGVSYLDSAFKRRWSFRYMPIEITPDALFQYKDRTIRYAGREEKYLDFVTSLNKILMNAGIVEDRLIGPWFIKPEELVNKPSSKGLTDSDPISKMLLYLWDDVLRYKKQLFHGIKSFRELLNRFPDEDIFGIYVKEVNIS